jgi:hypothetical protein
MNRAPAHAKPGNTRCEPRSNASSEERQNSLGAHVCVQRDAVEPAPPSAPAAMVRGVLESPGRQLDSETQSFMESRFGFNFSPVRLHTDEKAATSARVLGAAAYTVGTHIAFGAGQCVPHTTGGRRILAHELAHVVQQSRFANSSAVSSATPIRVSDRSDKFELAAERSTNAALASSYDGSPVGSTLALSAGIVEPGEITVQRLPDPVTPDTQTIQETPEAPKHPKAPLPLWNHLEPILDQELVDTYLEIGPIATRRVNDQVNDFFAPYTEAKTDQTFQDIINIASGGGSNALQDKLSDYASLSGGIGGAIAQAVQVYMAHALNSTSVDEVKNKATEGINRLEDSEFTRSSPLFRRFEKSAMEHLEEEVDQYWSWYGRGGPSEATEPDKLVVTKIFRDRVRDEYGVQSEAGQKILADVREAVKQYLEPLRKELEVAIAHQHRSRTKIAAVSGFLGGGLIGGALGAGLSHGNVGWAVAGGFIGGVIGGVGAGVSSLIANWAADKKRAKAVQEDSKK